MKQSEVDRLAQRLGEIYGLALKVPVHLAADKQAFSLEPDEVHPNESFQIDVQLGWRSIDIQFRPGRFAADLIQAMSESSPESKALFANIAGEMSRLRAVPSLIINSLNCDVANPESWPSVWRNFSFVLRKSPIEINTENHTLTEELVNDWVTRFYACIIAISPLESVDLEYDVPGLPEGAVKKVEVNRYERSRINRGICLSFHGPVCQVCKMSFRDTYGSIGEGFIHVHHITPVSQLGTGYLIDPIRDLVPVCPNCHAMLHRRNPPYSLVELRQTIEKINREN